MWGYYNDGIFRMILGGIIFIVTISAANQNYKHVVELNNWKESNQGNLVLFYPAKKAIQEKIKSTFIPLIPFKTLEVYYEGPKLVGDIKRSTVLEIMRWNNEVKVNDPAILKIAGRNVEVIKLPELLKIDTTEIETQVLVERIVRLKNNA